MSQALSPSQPGDMFRMHVDLVPAPACGPEGPKIDKDAQCPGAGRTSCPPVTSRLLRGQDAEAERARVTPPEPRDEP